VSSNSEYEYANEVSSSSATGVLTLGTRAREFGVETDDEGDEFRGELKIAGAAEVGVRSASHFCA
jgi:hypothetical protein